MKAAFIIEPIEHNDLDKVEVKILQDAVQKICDKRKKEFTAHLERASAIVEKWPEWKRNALGTIRKSG